MNRKIIRNKNLTSFADHLEEQYTKRVSEEIIADTSDFTKNQRYLSHEFNEILNATANFLEIDEVEQRLENVIIKHENRI